MCQKLWFGSSVMKLLLGFVGGVCFGFFIFFLCMRFLVFPNGLDEKSNGRGLLGVVGFLVGFGVCGGFFVCVCVCYW